MSRITSRSTRPSNSGAVGFPRRFAPWRLVNAVLWHLLASRFWIALTGSAVSAVLAFWAIALAAGHFAGEGGFLLEAVAVPLGTAVLVSAIVDLVLRKLKTHAGESSSSRL